MLDLKMSTKFYFRLCIFIAALQIVVIIVYNKYLNPDWGDIQDKFKYGMSLVIPLIKHGDFFLAWEAVKINCSAVMEQLLFSIYRSCGVWLIIPLIWIYQMLPNPEKGRDVIGGKEFINPGDFNRLVFKVKFYSMFWYLTKFKCIPIGEVYLPVLEEPKQTFAVGKPGSGKTNFFNYVIRRIRKRSQKIIIHDYKGDYVEKFYDSSRDKIFNPLDARSVGWCLFNDCTTVMDIEAFAWALIPAPVTGEPFWNNAARDIFTGVLYYCYYNNLRTNKDIWQTFNIPNCVLYAILRKTPGAEPGAKHLEDPDGRTALNIMSNLMTFIKPFEYMQHMDGDFSITQWVTSKTEKSTIFITNYANLQHTLSPIISLFIQTVGKVLLSQSDDYQRRLFFILDEFGQLPNMMTIKTLMTASRSKGGSVFIGVQDIGQVDQLYKKETRTTILNSASNRIIFNCKDGDTAEFFSNDIGDIEYYESNTSSSLGGGNGDRVNTNRQKIKERLVSKEEIQSLPDLRAFVSIAHHNIVYCKWKYLKLKTNAPAIIIRAGLDLANMVDVKPFAADAEVPQEEIKEKPAKAKSTSKKKAPQEVNVSKLEDPGFAFFPTKGQVSVHDNLESGLDDELDNNISNAANQQANEAKAKLPASPNVPATNSSGAAL